MTPSPVHIQIAPDSAPSTPPWLAEVVVCAQVLNQLGLFTALQQRVRFARARFGRDETCDVVVVLIGSALSGEATREQLYARLTPVAAPFLACFGRHALPDRSTRSRFLASWDQPTLEALRTLFLTDLVNRSVFSAAGGLTDRLGSAC
jgi:TRAP-type uncharacterized transport system fused permease subunit